MKLRKNILSLLLAGVIVITGCGGPAATLAPSLPAGSHIESETESSPSDLRSSPDASSTGTVASESSDEHKGEEKEKASSVIGDSSSSEEFDLSQIPCYTGSAYTVVNDNVPTIPEDDYTTDTFADLSELDDLGRCGVAYGCFGPETMTDEERGAIGHIKPSGWHTVKYNGLVDGNYLYNRCHLIMWKLSGILDDNRNLITGTRYLNIEGMLPFEEQLTSYVGDTGHHVMYRVTPIFTADELVARGVHMEAASVEDSDIRFNVYCYNVQPGIDIDYATGESDITEQSPVAVDNASSMGNEKSGNVQDSEKKQYVINKNTRKFHLPECSSVSDMKPQNKKEVKSTRDDLIEQGYDPCGICKP